MKENVRVQANIMKGINDISMKGEVVIFGSTYMAHFPLYELANKCMLENAIYNRSISGLTVKEAREIVKDCVISISPGKVFLALGEEDGEEPEAVNEYRLLVAELRAQLPRSEIYLIGITGGSEYAESFNRNIMSLCDGKKIKYINFVSKQATDAALYKARFKQLSCFFRKSAITMNEAFALSDI